MFAFVVCVLLAAIVGGAIWGPIGAAVLAAIAIIALGYAAVTTNWFV
jgi:hypothetical protein